VVSCPQISQPEPCIRLSSPLYALHAAPVLFFSILSPGQYWVRSTDFNRGVEDIILDPEAVYTGLKYACKKLIRHFLSAIKISNAGSIMQPVISRPLCSVGMFNLPRSLFLKGPGVL